jgi:type IV pilus assembly protein PilX
MLAAHPSRSLHTVARRAQAGMVMMVALIILIVMTLGGLALMRSMDTSNLIAGNMAFQQAATHSADAGVETAIAWLESQNNGASLDAHIPTVGYTASTANNAAFHLGEKLWADLSTTGVCLLPMAGGVCSASPGTPDASGNTISFVIQRLCSATGNRNGAFCAIPPGTSPAGNNEGAGEDSIQLSTAVYYRITVRVAGPKNTLSYVQAIVSM